MYFEQQETLALHYGIWKMGQNYLNKNSNSLY